MSLNMLQESGGTPTQTHLADNPLLQPSVWGVGFVSCGRLPGDLPQYRWQIPYSTSKSPSGQEAPQQRNIEADTDPATVALIQEAGLRATPVQVAEIQDKVKAGKPLAEAVRELRDEVNVAPQRMREAQRAEAERQEIQNQRDAVIQSAIESDVSLPDELAEALKAKKITVAQLFERSSDELATMLGKTENDIVIWKSQIKAYADQRRKGMVDSIDPSQVVTGQQREFSTSSEGPLAHPPTEEEIRAVLQLRGVSNIEDSRIRALTKRAISQRKTLSEILAEDTVAEPVTATSITAFPESTNHSPLELTDDQKVLQRVLRKKYHLYGAPDQVIAVSNLTQGNYSEEEAVRRVLRIDDERKKVNEFFLSPEAQNLQQFKTKIEEGVNQGYSLGEAKNKLMSELEGEQELITPDVERAIRLAEMGRLGWLKQIDEALSKSLLSAEDTTELRREVVDRIISLRDDERISLSIIDTFIQSKIEEVREALLNAGFAANDEQIKECIRPAETRDLDRSGKVIRRKMTLIEKVGNMKSQAFKDHKSRLLEAEQKFREKVDAPPTVEEGNQLALITKYRDIINDRLSTLEATQSGARKFTDHDKSQMIDYMVQKRSSAHEVDYVILRQRFDLLRSSLESIQGKGFFKAIRKEDMRTMIDSINEMADILSRHPENSVYPDQLAECVALFTGAFFGKNSQQLKVLREIVRTRLRHSFVLKHEFERSNDLPLANKISLISNPHISSSDETDGICASILLNGELSNDSFARLIVDERGRDSLVRLISTPPQPPPATGG